MINVLNCCFGEEEEIKQGVWKVSGRMIRDTCNSVQELCICLSTITGTNPNSLLDAIPCKEWQECMVRGG